MYQEKRYYKHDDYDVFVKDAPGGWYTFSPLRGDTGWVYDPDMCGINVGKHLEYSPISKDEARKILKKYHAEALIE